MSNPPVVSSSNVQEPSKAAYLPPDYSSNTYSSQIDSIWSERDTNIAHQISIIYETNVSSRYNGAFVPGPDYLPQETATPFHETLLHKISDHAWRSRLLVLHATPQVPSAELLDALAVRLRAMIATQVARPAAEIAVWIYTSNERDDDVFHLESELRRSSGPAIFVFPRATRQQLGWNLETLAHSSTSHPCVVIACSEQSAQQWRLHSSETSFCLSLAADDLFDPKYIVNLLQHSLAKNRAHLPLCVQPPSNVDAPWLGDWSLHDIALRVHAPVNAQAFLRALYVMPQSASIDELREYVQEFANQNTLQTLQRWYYDQFTRRNQLLAIGLTLFEGLQEASLFAALQQLLNSVWQQEDVPKILDHIDFEPVLTLFHVDDTDVYNVRIQSRLFGQRRWLIKMALHTHRRHMQRALPWLAQLIRQSYAQGASHNELFGASRQRDQLRAIVSTSISDVARSSPELAQPALLWLVAETRQDAAHVALARILSAWYTEGDAPKLLQVLNAWQTEARYRGFVQSLLGGQKDSETATSLIAAASLLVLTYTLRDAKPGAIEQPFLYLFVQFAQDPSARMHHYLRDYVLRMLPPYHLRQCSTLLQELAQRPDLRPNISARLARAYQTHSLDITKLIFDWYEYGRNSLVRGMHSTQPSKAEAILITLTATLSELPYDANSRISRTVAQRMQKHILNAVQHSLARIEVWTSCFLLANNDVAALNELLRYVQPKEEEQIVDMLTQTFLAQRAQLPGRSDATMLLDGMSFPVWLHRKPPETTVEAALRDALSYSQESSLRRIAFRSYMQFVERFDMPEDAFITKEVRRRDTPPPLHNASLSNANMGEAEELEPAFDSLLSQNTYRDIWLPRFIVAHDPQEYLSIVEDIVPLARKLDRQNPRLLVRLFERMHRHDDELGLIAERVDALLRAEQQRPWEVIWHSPVRAAQTTYTLWREHQLPPTATRFISLISIALLLVMLIVVLVIRLIVIR